MRIVLLGTGDAIGTPKVGCDCPVCTRALSSGTSRLRTSILVQNGNSSLLIDTSPDLRAQLLSNGSPVIDAVCWTHGHYDHYSGYGEFYRVQKPPPVYAAGEVLHYCAGFFDFLAFDRIPARPFVPIEILGITVTFFPVNHPPAAAYGVLCACDGNTMGYTADTNADLPLDSRRLLEGVDLLLVDAIAPGGVHIKKHMNYAEARALARDLRAYDWRCVHMSHMIPWDLPKTGVDGEVIDLC
jgi:phosphoribosyl 1,2-cyclic phosphate phosphodiesterase